MDTIEFRRYSSSFLPDRDLLFLVENLPSEGKSYEEISKIIWDIPNRVESLLDSEEIFQKIRDKSKAILEISPFLFFSVFVRRSFRDHQIRGDKDVVNYISNLLSLFVSKDRVYKVDRDDMHMHHYLVDMIQEARLADPRRQFLIYSHIGNYTLFLTGIFPDHVEYRNRYKKRPVDIQYYIDYGKTYYEMASSHSLARTFHLNETFLKLSIMFEVYRSALNHMSKQYLELSA